MNAHDISTLMAEYGEALDCIISRLAGVLGEGIVCAELKKRRVGARLCRGQKRSIDLLTDNGLRVQVKTAQKPRFLTGLAQKKFYKGHEPDVWILVLISGGALRFFVLTHREICKLQKRRNRAYQRRYLKRHRKPFTGRGVDSLPLAAVERHESEWSKLKTITR